MPLPRPPARDRILDVADRLFYQHGVRAVGVEAIVAEADAAKTTLYGHFGSKVALAVAYLERRATWARERIEQGLAAQGGPANERILHLYDLLAEELAEPGYRGSPFVNACVELGGDHPAAAVAREHRRWLLDTFTALAAEAGVADPAAVAAQLLQLYEASTVATQVGGDDDAARTARSAAATLLATPARRGSAEPAATSPQPDQLVERGQQSAPARLVGSGSPEAHRLVAFLNSAHLPDGDDQLADDRAGPWLAGWLADAGRAAADGLENLQAAPAELVVLREGLRQLAAVHCGTPADPRAVAAVAAVLREAPLLVELGSGGEPRLTATDDAADDADATRMAITVVAGAYLAVQIRGEWPRLKVCASPDCRWAFLDTTRNRSRRWCDMAGCGNRAKSRGWRDRHPN